MKSFNTNTTGALPAVCFAGVLASLYAGREAMLAPWLSLEWQVAFKWASIAILVALCFAHRTRRNGRVALLSAAMFLHSLGDVLIGLDHLLPAVAFFFVGHLGYSKVFLAKRDVFSNVSMGRRILSALLVVHGLVMMTLLLPALEPPFRYVIPVYSIALLLMALAVVAAKDTSRFTIAAAVLYAFSDSVIACDAFLGLSPNTAWLAYLTWPTYFVAQLLFTCWALGDDDQAKG